MDEDDRIILPQVPQQSSCNYNALDLICALEDLSDFHVAHISFYGIISHIASAAQDLHRVRRHLHAGIGSEALGHGGIHARTLPMVELVSSFIDQQARRFNLHSHIGQHELNALERADRMAKLFPFTCIVTGCLKCCLSHADGYGSYIDTATI